MSDSPSQLAERATELRSTFDRSFAEPAHAVTAAGHDLLAIRVGAEPYAVRLPEIAGLYVDRPITRVPGSDASLLGIAGFRGAIMPVYSLSALLGQAAARQTSRWLVIAASAPVALAFDLFESHLRVPTDAVLPRQAHGQMRSYAPNFVRSSDVVRPVLDLASVIAALEASEQTAVSP